MNQQNPNSNRQQPKSSPDAELFSTQQEQQLSDQLESWIHRIQSADTQSCATTDRIEQVALDLWNEAQGDVATLAPSKTNPNFSAKTFPQISGYQITDFIGQGGMGAVFRARDLKLGRDVALKVLVDDRLSSQRAKQRFQVEVQAAAQLTHPSIVPVYSFGEYDNGLFYSMREIQGQDLSKKLLAYDPDSTKPADINSKFGPWIEPRSRRYQRWVAQIGRAIADALAHSHERLVIHRDVKPANIIIDDRGEAFLTDFGLARLNEGSDLTEEQDIMGSLRYMSPEQFQGSNRIDPRTDIYSLGITIYELLIGRPAVNQTNLAAAWQQVSEGRITRPKLLNPTIESDLETIVLKAISPEPDLRYATADDFRDDLDRYLKVLPIQAKPPTFGLKLNRWIKRNKTWVAALGLVIGSLMAVIFGFAVYHSIRASNDATTIRQRTAERLDQSGVDLLFRNESLKAKEDFSQAARLSDNPQDRRLQQQRIDGINAWAPQLSPTARYHGRLLASHPNGFSVIVDSSDGQQRCFLREGEDEKLILGTDKQIKVATFSPDGTQIALAVGDRSNRNPEIRIFHTQDGQLKSLPGEFEWRVTDMWFLDNQGSLLLTGWDGSAQIWNSNNLKRMKRYDYPTIGSAKPWVFSAVTDRHKKTMVAVLNPRLIVALKLPELEPIWDQPIELSSWETNGLTISDDGQWLAVGTQQDGMRIWQVTTGRELSLAGNTKGQPSAATFSSDGKHLAVGDNYGGVYVWRIPEDLDQVVARAGVVMWHDSSIESLKFNTKNQLAVATSDSVRVWRLSDNEPLCTSIPVVADSLRVFWDTEDQLSMTTSIAGQNRLFKGRLPEHFQITKSYPGMLSQIFSADGKLYSLVKDDATNGLSIKKPNPEQDTTDSDRSLHLTSLSYGSDHGHLVISKDHSTLLSIKDNDGQAFLRGLDRSTGKPDFPKFEVRNWPAVISLNHDGSLWLSSSYNQHIIVGDVTTGKPKYDFVLPNWIKSAEFLEANEVASICWDGKLRIWSESGVEIGEFNHSSLPDRMVSDSDWIAVADVSELSLYHRDSGVWTKSKTIDHGSAKIGHLSIDAEQQRIVTCGENGKTKLWDFAGSLIAELRSLGPVKTCLFSPDSRWIATLDRAGRI
ncbi:MAG: WD40 repeat domain-containing serine/threonine protein kinase, partial [Planctomycetota bacterium]